MGSGSPGGVLRNTQTTYNTASNYIAANMLGLTAEVKVEDGSNKIYTDTQYTYDAGTIYNDPNLPGTYHDNSNYGTGNTTRGNLTKIVQCLNLSSWVVS